MMVIDNNYQIRCDEIIYFEIDWLLGWTGWIVVEIQKKKKKQNGCFDIDQGRTNTHTYTRTNIEKLSPKIEKTLFDKLLHI